MVWLHYQLEAMSKLTQHVKAKNAERSSSTLRQDVVAPKPHCRISHKAVEFERVLDDSGYYPLATSRYGLRSPLVGRHSIVGS